jgi:hypothetical protein
VATTPSGQPRWPPADSCSSCWRGFWHPEFHALFFKGYYRLVGERRAALVALEARDYAEIDRFCRDFGVTHFVFDRTRPLPPVVPARARLFENASFLVMTCALGR